MQAYSRAVLEYPASASRAGSEGTVLMPVATADYRRILSCMAFLLPFALLTVSVQARAEGKGQDPSAAPSSAEEAAVPSKRTSLKKALAELKVPPGWFKSVTVRYDTNKPWKEARLHIRKLLGGGQAREAIKITYLYAAKGDMGDGHELPLYLFLGGEHVWALVQFEKRLSTKPEGQTHDYLCLASCYAHFGEYRKALAVLDMALARLPKPPWRTAREADVHSHIGDIYAEMGGTARATKHYGKAIELYPASKQPWGRHLLKKQAARVQAKLDILSLQSLDLKKLPDGTYVGASLGYKGDVKVTVTLQKGRIADIKVEHKEDIERNATKIVPQRIIEAQGLKVDAVTGATTTSNALIAATFEALKKAGLKK